MFSVIFEVLFKAGKTDEYLAYAKQLKPILESIDGFVDNERFASRLRPGWLLSHSSWRDEKSVVRWRTQSEHHGVQEKGRFEIFEDYHLRVGEVSFDSNPPKGASTQGQRVDETEVGIAKVATLTEITTAKGAPLADQIELLPARMGLDVRHDALVAHDIFESIYNPGKLALLIGWKDAEAANAWSPGKSAGVDGLRHRQIRILREYGRFDRREAPQYYPDVPGRETRHAEPARKPDAAAN